MRLIACISITLFIICSCGINSNLMFKSPVTEDTTSDSVPLRPLTEYTFAPDDKFSYVVYENYGQSVVDNMTSIGSQGGAGVSNLEHLVEQNGTVKFPVIGEKKIQGFTIRQLEDTLAKYYSRNYNRPYVQVTLTNQRVIVFPGGGSDAKVITLSNTNTTLVEAIALAGGIADRGKASKVKLMRLINGKRVVYVLDLSTIDGLKYADLVLQANDYIYIEPAEQVVRELGQTITPVVSLLSSILLIFSIFLTLNK